MNLMPRSGSAGVLTQLDYAFAAYKMLYADRIKMGGAMA